jgi:bacterioferritin-associated ferredoxin
MITIISSSVSTLLQDQRLREGVSTYNKDWNQIALHVGISANSSKCRKRWARLQEKVRRSQDEDLILPDSYEAAD